MGHLQRHAVAETCKMFLVTLTASVLLLAFGGGAKEAFRNGLPPHLVLQLFPFLILEMLRFTVPGCLLFAVCSVYGRMAASNELTAIKSIGVSPWEVIWPSLATAGLLSIGTFLVYDACASWARPNLKRIVVQSVAEVAYGVLRADKSFSTQGLSIVVKGVDGRRLQRPVITVVPKKGGPDLLLTADEAELHLDKATGSLQLICYDTRVVAGKWTLDLPERFVHEIPIGGALGQPPETLSPAALPRSAIPKQLDHQRRVIDQLRSERDSAGSEAERNKKVDEMAYHRTRLFRLHAEPQRRLANGLACFCFALVGIPVAIWWKSADSVSAFFVCFLPILLVYYPMLVVGETIARKGIYPQASVWLADAVMLVAGIWLCRRSLRR